MNEHDDTCPRCNRGDRVGRLRVVYECVDVRSGDIVRRDDPEWRDNYECGWCGYGWETVYAFSVPSTVEP